MLPLGKCHQLHMLHPPTASMKSVFPDSGSLTLRKERDRIFFQGLLLKFPEDL